MAMELEARPSFNREGNDQPPIAWRFVSKPPAILNAEPPPSEASNEAGKAEPDTRSAKDKPVGRKESKPVKRTTTKVSGNTPADLSSSNPTNSEPTSQGVNPQPPDTATRQNADKEPQRAETLTDDDVIKQVARRFGVLRGSIWINGGDDVEIEVLRFGEVASDKR
jgi:hypothetical protein